MNNNRVEEIKKEDKKAFKSFIIVMIISAMGGAIIGGASIYLQKHIGDELSDFLLNILMTITPYASLVLSILVTIVSVIVYNSSRKKLKLWNQSDEQDEIIDNIEVKLSYVLLFASVNLIIGFFFGAGMGLLSEDSYAKVISFFIGFVVCILSTILIQNKVVNLEKEINPFLNGSVYDFKFSKKWIDSCDEAIKLNIYKSSFKAHKSVTNTCLILWIICVIGYDFFDFGIMPLVMVTIIWLVQTVSYCRESIKCSKNNL